MAKRRKKGPKPVKAKQAKTGVARVMAIVLVLAMLIPTSVYLLSPVITLTKDFIDSSVKLSDDARDLKNILTDSGCPEQAAQSIAVKSQDNDWLPAMSVYYIPSDKSYANGSAVLTTKRHMISAGISNNRLDLIQITDAYQNASLLQQAGLEYNAAVSAAEWLYNNDSGLISGSVTQTDAGNYEFTLPDGRFLLSGDETQWSGGYIESESDTEGSE